MADRAFRRALLQTVRPGRHAPSGSEPTLQTQGGTGMTPTDCCQGCWAFLTGICAKPACPCHAGGDSGDMMNGHAGWDCDESGCPGCNLEADR